MSQPLVSFIVTTYNLPVALLEECLNSILALSLTKDEREIILVDDGSDTPPINQLPQKGELIFIRQDNQGLSVARNIGIERAQGEYIQFVDGDDYLLTVPYEHCLDLVRRDRLDMVLFHASADSHHSVSVTASRPMSGIQYMAEHNVRSAVWGCIFRRQTLGDLRFTPGIYHEDEDFTPQLLLRCERIVDSHVAAYFYRQHAASITHSTDAKVVAKRFEDTLRVITHLRNIAFQLPTSSRMALQRRVAQLTMDYLYQILVGTRSRQRLEATIHLLSERGCYPLPNRHYTLKYTLFRSLIASSWGRRLLVAGIKTIK